jgi:cytidylate kinase
VPYKVVCISATDGSMGAEVGPLVAERLGFGLVNEQIVAQAAEEAGIQAHVMANVEVRRSVVDRVIHQLLSSKATTAPRGLAPAAAAEPAPSVDSLRGLIRSVIEDFADRGDAVLVSHAASHALADRPDALRVLITAGSQTRRARVTAGRNVSEKDADKLIARGDANRADYIKRFYDVAAEQPTHYDIVLNTDRLGVEQAVDLIVQVASGETASAPVTEAPAT